MINAPPPASQEPTDASMIRATGPRVMLLQGGGTTVAMLAASAREVLARMPAIRLPAAPEFVCGVVNVRGTLVPLVDLGRLLDHGPSTPSGWVVTLELGGRRCALAVDTLPVLRDAEAPPGARPAGSALLRSEVRVAGTTLPLLDVAAMADDLLLQ